jgi:hypothetical protein
MLQSDDGCNTAYTERRLGYVLDTTVERYLLS